MLIVFSELAVPLRQAAKYLDDFLATVASKHVGDRPNTLNICRRRQCSLNEDVMHRLEIGVARGAKRILHLVLLDEWRPYKAFQFCGGKRIENVRENLCSQGRKRLAANHSLKEMPVEGRQWW